MPTARIDPEVGCAIPEPGAWPIDPQEDQEIDEARLWIDGCFDFFHHGHTGVMLQSRRLGKELVVGLHSDEDITANKGPTVMNLAERTLAVNACRFSTKCVPHAPYVTSLPWISHYGCKFVTHGDDITSDASGGDCYRFVKKAGRMKIVPRTPGISTTDLVGRMLNCTKDHFIRSLSDVLEGKEKSESGSGPEMSARIYEYAAAPNGLDPYVSVYSYVPTQSSLGYLVPGNKPQPDQRFLYVDGGFDLFSSGHIAFLKQVSDLEAARQHAWSKDYPPAYIIAGLHDDAVINKRKGINYPIMNIFERGLCVIQCQYLHGVVFGAPAVVSKPYLSTIAHSIAPGRIIDAIYHGPTSSMPPLPNEPADAYEDVKEKLIRTEEHDFQDVDSAAIVKRILDKRVEYEERQRKKGQKSVGEGALRREELEKEAAEEAERRKQAVTANGHA
ncbi:ethanolamine-phosphate cytidylyltransferase-like [Teratosphaeria destructans]|uniref:ethanolamine-phosphate cytidylyltransferase n=1 Tax=Teratosphaeria destructans TaxID=418781 RepID=A0A9W7VYC4_9PEZI|nr:ethanolamine-phosphate cytidylyltransferase-like [Teratosphaeria destructans]